MATAADVMHRPAPSVTPETPIREVYERLEADHLEGLCVAVGDRLEGVVTSMDLVFREKNVHMPTFFYFLDAVIPTSDPRRTFEEVSKMAAATAGDLATKDVVTVTSATSVARCATLMVERHLTVLPVVDDHVLVGMVTKQDVLRATFG